MVDITLLREKYGLSQENLKKWLAGDPKYFAYDDPQLPPLDETEKTVRQKRAALHHRIKSRIDEGRMQNFSTDFRVFYALDQIWDTAFQQITPTLLSTFLDSNPDPNDQEVYKQMQQLGLEEFITETKDCKSGQAGPGKKAFNLPMFFQIVVPLVASYVKIRWARIMNDRLLTPFMKYEPVKQTTPLRVKCEALTDRIQVMSNQYGHYDVLKQGVLKNLHYGACFQFPKEEWHCEEQIRIATDEDVANKKTNLEGKPANVGDQIQVTVREGLRYHHPHPTRMYWDKAHPAWTYNFDIGCEFAGYWKIVRYRDILNGDFWNKDKVSLGSADLIANNRIFFNTVYASCTMMTMGCIKAVDGPNSDREQEVANSYYNTDLQDAGVLLTEHWEKLVPKDNGLGDYPHPVWMRFLVAGDGCTIVYAAPVPYSPVEYMGYDADESRSRNPSLSLEILPFQDQFSMVLTQIILTAKQNLANLTLVDGNQIDAKTKEAIQNIGEKLFRKLNIFEYDGRKAMKAQNRINDAIQNYSLPKGNVAELISVLKVILDVLERVLVMSSLEAGQAASHEQTREEIKNINQSTSTRLQFTATPVDIFVDAWKRKLYIALMAYGDDDFYVYLPNDIPLDKEQLEALGFTYVDDDEYPNDRTKQYRTTKQAVAAPLWSFASARDGQDRANDREVAIAMSTLVQNMLSNPMMAAAIGPEQGVELANKIAQLAGLPRDFKLRNVGPSVPPEQAAMEQQQQMQQQLQQLTQEVLQTVSKEVAETTKQISDDVKDSLKQVMDKTKENTQDIKQNSRHIDMIMETLLDKGNGNGNGSRVKPSDAPSPRAET